MTAGRIIARDAQPTFKGGLNTTADESRLEPDEVREAENCRLTEFGGITKRLGTQRTHEEALQALSLQPVAAGFTWRSTTPATHLAICDGHLHSAPHGSYPWSWSDHGPGLDPAAFPSMVSFRDATDDCVYIADGGPISRYKAIGGLSLNVPGTPNVSQLAVHNLRLFGIGDPASPEGLYFSGLSNGDTLGSVPDQGGLALVRTFANERLTALLPVGQSLLLFHERGISRFTGWSQDDFNVNAGTRGVTQDVGTIAARSVVGVENVGFFLSDRGAYAVTESGVQAISPKIEATLAQVSSADLVRVSAVHHRAFREVWFFIPNLGVMAYNYRLQAWTGPFTGTYVDRSPCVFWESGAGITPQVLFGGNDGFVRQADVLGTALDDAFSDGSESIPYSMVVRCHRLFCGDPAGEKSLRYIYATANLRGSTGTTISWETGEEAASALITQLGTVGLWGRDVWGDFTFGQAGSTTSRVHAHGRGRYIDVRITDDGVTNPVFSRIEAQGFQMGRRY